jgi:hypothetical protein
MYETPNTCIVLERESLGIEEWLVGHQVFSISVRARKEV